MADTPRTFTDLVHRYLDNMPTRSQVTITDLATVVMDQFASGPGGSYTAKDRTYVKDIIHAVIKHRTDVTLGRNVRKQ